MDQHEIGPTMDQTDEVISAIDRGLAAAGVTPKAAPVAELAEEDSPEPDLFDPYFNPQNPLPGMSSNLLVDAISMERRIDEVLAGYSLWLEATRIDSGGSA